MRIFTAKIVALEDREGGVPNGSPSSANFVPAGSTIATTATAEPTIPKRISTIPTMILALISWRLTFLRFTGANRTPNSIELETQQRAVRVRCNR